MATLNPFDLLGNDDSEDPSQLIQKIEPKKALAPSAAAPTQQQQAKPAAAKLPSRPPPPAEAVREEKSESARGRGGRGYGRGRGRGRGYNRDSTSNDNYGNVEISGGQGTPGESDFRKPYERHGGHDGPRGSYGGGRRGGFSNGEAWEGEQGRPRRVFDRHSGSVHGNEMKREGAGRGNWGAQTDEFAEVTEEVANEGEKSLNAEKPSGEEETADGNKETSATEIEEKEPENKEMTLEEYEKVLEEKRKALLDLKTEERKVDVKEFESMQPLANKKSSDDIFIKLGSLKDKKKELAEKEERAKKSVSINEFLKPAEGERYSGGRDRGRGRGGPRGVGGGEPAEGERYSGGRGRGRGRGGPRGSGGGEPAEGERYSGGQGRGRGRDGPRGGGGGETSMSNVKAAPAIEDPGQFPTLGAK